MPYFIETVAFFEKDTISIPVMKITLNLIKHLMLVYRQQKYRAYLGS